MFISRVVRFCKNWYYSFCVSKVTELEDYIARLEKALDDCHGEREYLIYLAECRASDAIEDLAWERVNFASERVNFEYQLSCKEDELQEYKQAEQERRDREEEERQEKYRHHCPLCGSRRVGG